MGSRSARKRRHRVAPDTAWTAFERATVAAIHPALAPLVDRQEAIYVNNRYQVAMRQLPPRDGWPLLVHLSIKRRDKAPIHDWRDLLHQERACRPRERGGRALSG